MIINALCNSCLQPFQLMVEPGEVSLVKQIASDDGTTCPCPKLCGGAINLVGDPVISAMAADGRMREPISLSGKQLYQAVSGMGLPEEVPKNADIVDAMFKANKVVKVDTETHHGRIYLHEIHFENGVVIHLASGAKGAHVLRMTKETKNG